MKKYILTTLMIVATTGTASAQSIPDEVLVPRTVVVPKTVWEEKTVYDRYKILLVPESELVRTPVVNRPVRTKLKFKLKTRNH